MISLLCQLGITANYDGFYQTAYAVKLASEGPVRLQSVTNCIYPEVATKYNTSPDNVRKNISKVRDIAWKKNPEFLCKIAQHQLKKKPGTGEFLAILAVYSICQKQFPN